MSYVFGSFVCCIWNLDAMFFRCCFAFTLVIVLMCVCAICMVVLVCVFCVMFDSLASCLIHIMFTTVCFLISFLLNYESSSSSGREIQKKKKQRIGNIRKRKTKWNLLINHFNQYKLAFDWVYKRFLIENKIDHAVWSIYEWHNSNDF